MEFSTGGYFIVLFHVSGHLEQFYGILFFGGKFIILVEWGRPGDSAGDIVDNK